MIAFTSLVSSIKLRLGLNELFMDLKNHLHSALIIEQQPLAQSHLKYSLTNIGFDNVDIVDRSYLALRALKTNRYDLIICASDLSKGADGYQLYEQIVAEGLLLPSMTFIYLSSENDLASSQSVIELNPDDVILKPFTTQNIEKRLIRSLSKKIAIKDVLLKLDQYDYKAANLKLNNHISNNKNPLKIPYLMKMKGDIILSLQHWDSGERFFSKVISIHPHPWALLGLTECQIHLDKTEEALTSIEQLFNQPQTKLAALDHLSVINQKLHDFDKALVVLKQATEISPRNINRLKELVSVARLTHDYECQHEASNHIIRNSKFSIHDSPQVYLSAVRSAIDLGLTSFEEEDVLRLIHSSQSILGSIKGSFKSDAITSQIDVVQARLFNLKNEKAKAKELLSNSIKRVEHQKIYIDETNQDDVLDLAKAFHELGLHKLSHILFNELAEYCQSPEASSLFSQYIAVEKSLRNDIKESPKELNNKAVSFFEAGHLDDALKAFDSAFKVMPKSSTIALNLMQTLIESNLNIEHHELKTIIIRCKKTILQSELTEAQTLRFEKLNEMLEQQYL